MENSDSPPPGEPCLDVEKVIHESARRILLDAADRFPTMTIEDAERFARITWRASDEEMVAIGIMDADAIMEIDGDLGSLCGDCAAKAN